jgi:hypothetical protein
LLLRSAFPHTDSVVIPYLSFMDLHLCRLDLIDMHLCCRLKLKLRFRRFLIMD